MIVQRVVRFLRDTLLPRAEAEERILYAEVARLVGNAEATAPMILDRRGIVERASELGAHDADAEELQELFALISTQLRKGEGAYLLLLDEQVGPDMRRALESVERLEASPRHVVRIEGGMNGRAHRRSTRRARLGATGLRRLPRRLV